MLNRDEPISPFIDIIGNANGLLLSARSVTKSRSDVLPDSHNREGLTSSHRKGSYVRHQDYLKLKTTRSWKMPLFS